MTNLPALLDEYQELKAKADEIQEALEAARDQLVTAMQKLGAKSTSVQLPDKLVKGTLIEVSRIVINEPALKKKIGAEMWNKVTKRVLDKPKLEAAMALGEVDPNTVASVSEEVPNKPYIRLNISYPRVLKSAITRVQKKRQKPA